MRKTFRGSFYQKNDHKEFRINEKITVPQVVVIDETGANLGELDTAAAIAEARNRDLDLVEVSPKSAPPICRIMNYGSFKYQQEKQERKQKARQKSIEIKTIKLSLRIGQHDLAMRVERGAEFLADGDKLKIELQLRGRENQHNDLARELIDKTIGGVREKLNGKEVHIEQPIKKMGNRFSTVISL